MDTERVVTQSQLVKDLRHLGVQRGDLIMMHESVRRIGWVAGGPDVVLHAVLEALGPEGTLMKYVGSEDGTYSLDEWPEPVRRAYIEECPAYDPQRTRAVREWGILTEYLRTWPGACRSGHPDGSFAAVGRLAEWLTRDHPLQYGLGPGSPLAKLLEQGGRILLLGSNLTDVTFLHYTECLADLPYKKTVRYRMPVLEQGQRVWKELEEYDSSNGIVDWPGEDYFGLIVKEFLASGRARQGKVGFADSCLMEARELHQFGKQWMERELLPYAKEHAPSPP